MKTGAPVIALASVLAAFGLMFALLLGGCRKTTLRPHWVKGPFDQFYYIPNEGDGIVCTHITDYDGDYYVDYQASFLDLNKAMLWAEQYCANKGKP